MIELFILFVAIVTLFVVLVPIIFGVKAALQDYEETINSYGVGCSNSMDGDFTHMIAFTLLRLRGKLSGKYNQFTVLRK